MGSFAGGLAAGYKKTSEQTDADELSGKKTLMTMARSKIRGASADPARGNYKTLLAGATAGLPSDAIDDLQRLPEKHRGGKIRKTGAYSLKRGEVVIPAKVVNQVERLSKRKVGRKKARSSGRR